MRMRSAGNVFAAQQQYLSGNTPQRTASKYAEGTRMEHCALEAGARPATSIEKQSKPKLWAPISFSSHVQLGLQNESRSFRPAVTCTYAAKCKIASLCARVGNAENEIGTPMHRAKRRWQSSPSSSQQRNRSNHSARRSTYVCWTGTTNYLMKAPGWRSNCTAAEKNIAA